MKSAVRISHTAEQGLLSNLGLQCKNHLEPQSYEHMVSLMCKGLW